MTGHLGALARGRISARARNIQVHDGRSYQVAPLGPRAVVVANVLVAEQILQDKPGMRTALADAAIGDGFVGTQDAVR